VSSVEPFCHDDLPTAQRLLAGAFRDNPLNRAVIGGSARGRLQANSHGMRAHLPQAERYGLLLSARADGRLVGVLSSTPPGAYPLPPPSIGVRLRCLLGQGLRVSHRWAKVYELLRDHHPVERHWYLGTIGVDPELQGRGIGTELLAAWLQLVDADGSPAYLETDAAENLSFYRRAGFDIIEKMGILGVPVWAMRREAGRTVGMVEEKL
jgi:ribosomal protein S18 acetylase RimI-like enzyme